MPRQRAGFTLIELLIVVVIIGILAAIAVPKFQNTKGKAYWAAMRSDLHSLTEAEEGYYYTNATYTTNVAALNMNLSQGVSIVIGEATASGWSATATHSQANPHLCTIYVGSATPLPPAPAEGIVGCQ